ncbi:hypothetical protein SLITO_v1c03430 [Spiroplasma litorale]|uniref:Uncharacterized protein n=1 Tax=Spiroplasma litorale TaxID=216942 RepID=A0A0K1W1M6_9MOLU|nr:hypothetical protein [Spiroplasma litorale]AKX33997.1 hypothetical protein SLITO_v1c03430 [Spiroplasma litorale]
MNKIEQNNNMIKEMSIINEQLDKVKLDTELVNFIKKNMFLIKNKLKGFLDIKTHGSYSINNFYNFDDSITIDLLAIKYVSKKTYNKYQREFVTNDHFVSCIICSLNNQLMKKLSTLYLKDKMTKVSWKEKNYKLPTSSEIIKFTDSILVNFQEIKDKVLKFNIRTVIKFKEYPVIICSKTMYKRSFTLEFAKMYKTLNKLTLKKVQLLFFYIRVKFRNKLNKKRQLILKLEVLQDIQLQLSKNKYFQLWLDKTFDNVFKSKKEVENLLESRQIYYKKFKKTNKLYNLIKLKNLKWVFIKSYNSVKKFLDFYLGFCKDYSENLPDIESENLYFWYDSVAYLKNEFDTSNFTVKKDNKKYDEIEDFKIITKTVYPFDKNNGLFLVFLKYFNFEVI